MSGLPKCPHCGHEERDAWEIDFGPGLDGETDVSCNRCGNDYFCQRFCSVTYQSTMIARLAGLTVPEG